jgi:hypothetical protein
MTKKSDELLAVEQEHGFIFGGDGSHETANAAPAFSVVCQNPKCSNLNQHIQLHEDSVLPIHCGGMVAGNACGQVLYCTHSDTIPVEHHEGTLASPLRVNRDVCVLCNASLNRTVTELSPIPLDSIPLHLLGGANIDQIVQAQS